jgi:hypothetical protein
VWLADGKEPLTARDIFPELSPPKSEEEVLEDFQSFLTGIGTQADQPGRIIRKKV